MSATRTRRTVVYLHHTRDRDGDVIFYFMDQEHGRDEPLQSSPVLSIKRCLSAVLDQNGHGHMARYLIGTQNSDYEVQMPRDKADHLATELGSFLVDVLEPNQAK